jgi:hypothetical protein
MGESRFPRQVAFRVTEELYEQIAKDAADNGRSIGQTIRFRLEHAYGLRDGE